MFVVLQLYDTHIMLFVIFFSVNFHTAIFHFLLCLSPSDVLKLRSSKFKSSHFRIQKCFCKSSVLSFSLPSYSTPSHSLEDESAYTWHTFSISHYVMTSMNFPQSPKNLRHHSDGLNNTKLNYIAE